MTTSQIGYVPVGVNIYVSISDVYILKTLPYTMIRLVSLVADLCHVVYKRVLHIGEGESPPLSTQCLGV